MKNHYWKSILLAALSFCLLISFNLAIAQNYHIVDLGALGNEHMVAQSVAGDINARGQVVGTTNYGAISFLWEKGEMIDLHMGDPWAYSHAWGINNRGQIVGWSYNTEHAYLWKNDEFIDIGTLGGNWSSSMSINNRGQVVGNASTGINAPGHAFIWEKGIMKDLGTLGGENSGAIAINNSSEIVGYSNTYFGATHAFFWEKGEMIDLGTLGGDYSVARGINNKGQIVGECETITEVRQPCLWDDDTIIDLGTLGGEGTAYDINEKGQVIGYSVDHSNPVAGGRRAFLWTEEQGIEDLNLFLPLDSGWILISARAINNIGQIVGNGLIDLDGDGSFESRAFLLTPVPKSQ